MGSTLDVRLIGKPGDGDVQLLSSTGTFQFSIKESRDSATLTILPETPAGVHWIRFVNDFGATELMPFFVGLIPEISEVEPNNRLSEGNPAASPSVTVNGVLEKSGDVDCYSVTLKAGQTIVASLQANRILNSPMDGVLQLVNERGTVLVQNDDDDGLDPLLSFTAPTDGTWYVRTFAFPASPDSSIRFAGAPTYVYRLILTTEAFVDFCQPRVRSRADSESPLTLRGWNLANASVSLPASVSRLGIGVRPMDVPFVDLRSVTEPQLDTDRVVLPATAVSGIVETRDDDVFAINAVKGTSLSLMVRAQEFASSLDPIVRIRDASGKVIQESDDISGENPDVSVRFNPPADGRYSLHVSDRFRHFGDRYFYVLQLEESRPAVRISAAKTAFVLPADKPLEIPLSISRIDGFEEPLDIRVEGLPEGVTAEPVRSEKDGDSSKTVTLKIAGASATVRRVLFSIKATTTAEGSQSFFAAMSLADRSETRELVLIIPAPTAAASPN
ncbi:MAG: pre-peptidase C-terminal domain-containing protein [Planctomycetota bacterium]